MPTINYILEQSGPKIAAFLDPSSYQTEVEFFQRTTEESLTVYGAIKESGCPVKIHVKRLNDDFTTLDIVAEAEYDVRFHTFILTNLLTIKALQGYVQAALRGINADLKEDGLVD